MEKIKTEKYYLLSADGMGYDSTMTDIKVLDPLAHTDISEFEDQAEYDEYVNDFLNEQFINECDSQVVMILNLDQIKDLKSKLNKII